jgi:DNA-binding GntR family transcriptional regulator
VAAKTKPDTSGAKKETGSARVYATLREEILRMQLLPGSLIDEVRLSERFGLSRSPVREALVRLSSDGLVIILPNRSTVITPIDFQAMPNYLDGLDLMQRAVTRLAAIHRTEADLAAIVDRQLRYETAAQESIATNNSLPMIEANHAFHMSIAHAGKNGYFTSFYKRLLDEGRRMLHLHFEFQNVISPVTVKTLAADHTRMVEAIRDRDADRADSIAHDHAAMFRGRFMQYLDRNITAGMRLENTIGAASADGVGAETSGP